MDERTQKKLILCEQSEPYSGIVRKKHDKNANSQIYLISQICTHQYGSVLLCNLKWLDVIIKSNWLLQAYLKIMKWLASCFWSVFEERLSSALMNAALILLVALLSPLWAKKKNRNSLNSQTSVLRETKKYSGSSSNLHLNFIRYCLLKLGHLPKPHD